ncbi:MAG: TonB-dependent receptor [Bacteroidetes bacterium]|nr:TonB-dependent receptor [Bacteroidota bacterium]
MHRIILTIFIAALSTVQLFSQQINGIILNDENNKPIPDANISIINSNKGTVSNEKGFFTINYSEKDVSELLISCLGFESIRLKLFRESAKNTLTIKLQPTTIQLNKSIVVTASKNNLVSHKLPEAVSVLTEEELIFNAPRSMAEALVGVPGVWMQKTNHGGGSPFLRGLTGNQTLLLVDGIRLNNAAFRYGPNQYFNTIDVFSVNQVEIIRGKGSVLYGSDALGGVINVITQSPEFFTKKARLKGRGRLKLLNKGMEQSGAGELEYQSQKFAISGNVNYKNFGDLYAGGNLGFERPSGYNETGTNLKTKLRLTDKFLITSALNYLIQNKIPRYDQIAQRGYETYLFDPQIHSLFYARAEYFGNHPVFKKIRFTLSNQLSNETRKTQKQESAIFKTENDVVKNYGFVLDNFSEFSESWTAVSGLEFYSDLIHSTKIETNIETREKIKKRGLYPNNSKMKNFAVFSQHSLKFEKINLQLGGRFNANQINSVDEGFGEIKLKPQSLVGNFAFQYLPNKSDNFILSANTAFRTPNINDISTFGLFDYGIEIPSENLSPEKTLSFEAGYKKLTDRFTLSMFAFNTRLKDQIVRVKSEYNGDVFYEGEPVYTKQNLAKSNIFGIEAESGIKLNSQFSLINSITWLQGKNLKNDEPMRRIPPLNGKLALRYSKSRLFGETEFLFATKQDRLSNGDIDDHRIPQGGTPGWDIINFKLGYAWNKISLHSGIQNIFNQAYRLHGSGVDGFGRSAWVSLQFEV